MLEINQVFNDKYKIIKVIGQGGMGRVYLAEHTSLKNNWAIKEMLFDINSPIDLLAEPNILKQLDHPSLPRIVDIVEENDTIYIIMDYVDGVSLKQELKEKKKLSEKKVVDFGKQLCEVFIYLHNHKPAPIIFRDMKPDNVMLTKDGKLKVIDFGIAREFKEGSQQDTVLGYTKGYAAPEQQNKDTQSDGRTDIYSLGVTLYHLVTGKSPYEPPYDFTKLREVDSSLSEGLEFIIRKCVQPNPDDRYQNAEELLYDFNNIHKLNSTYKRAVKKYYFKKIVSALVFISFVMLTTSGFKTMAKEKESLYSSLLGNGISLVKQHKVSQGLSSLKQAQVKLPKRVDSYREIARTYFVQQEYDKCISYVEDDLFALGDNFQNDDQILYIVGSAYFNQNQYNKSSSYFKKASEISNTIIAYKRDLVVSLGKENKIAEAENIINDIKSNNGEESTIQYVLGEINTIKKDYPQAVLNFEKAINSKDNEIKLKGYKSIAKLYINNPESFPNSLDREIATLERATGDLKELNDAELIEMQGKAYFNKAMSQPENKAQFKANMNKSMNCFQNLIDMGFTMPYIYVNIADIYSNTGEYAKSEKVLKEVIKNNRDYLRAYVEITLLYAAMEDDNPLEKRDYSKVMENYNLALKHSKNKEKDPQLAPLINLINQLKANKLIK
ncbi:MAG: protein kinase domain-containing protein [Clostridium sp.]|uniref:serine/threonine-protein kinase n=1 Tax=Clostridium sp. TaxID=1506 RepID=UPI003D6CD897